MLILVVDDEVQVTRSIARLLRRHGHEVRTAGSAQEALGMLDGVELLLTDVRMPGASGFDLAAAVKRLRPTLRCFVMSGDVGAEEMQPAAPDVDGRIGKPFSHEALLELLGANGSWCDARKAGS